MTDARALAEETARASYGRLLAWLSSRTSDLAAAEDALADAFKAALETWPRTGAPEKPEAWLLTAARRKLIDAARRRNTRDQAQNALILASEEAEYESTVEKPFPDERLKLLFICAHPAIENGIRTPLMLQSVLGLDASKIASAFLVSPAAMSARLVRAKRKIKLAGIPFAMPEPKDVPARLPPVLDAIYAAYGTSWNDVDGATSAAPTLTEEALFLARLLCELMPDEPEAFGLYALMLHADARRKARRHADRYVPLEKQNVELWDKARIAEAENALAHAWRLENPGRYQYEAAIQSAHVASRRYGKNTTNDVVSLYRQLSICAPSIGVSVGYAAALAAAAEPMQALAVLDGLAPDRVKSYQPFWAVRAHVLAMLKDYENAVDAYDIAIGLAGDPQIQRFLTEKKSNATFQNQ